MARKGRKRKEGKRMPSGRLVKEKAPAPTQELLARRRTMTGCTDLPADFPLAVLLGRTRLVDTAFGQKAVPWITREQYDAGMAFAALYWRLFGRPFGSATKLEPSAGREPDPGRELRDRRRYDAAAAALKRPGRAVWIAIMDAVVTLRFDRAILDIAANREPDLWCRNYVAAVTAGLNILVALPGQRVSHEEVERARSEVVA